MSPTSYYFLPAILNMYPYPFASICIILRSVNDVREPFFVDFFLPRVTARSPIFVIVTFSFFSSVTGLGSPRYDRWLTYILQMLGVGVADSDKTNGLIGQIKPAPLDGQMAAEISLGDLGGALRGTTDIAVAAQM